MKINPNRIAKAKDILAHAVLNDAEQLRLAEKLIDDVFTRVNPLTDPQMCIAEGYLASASHAVDQAKQLVEGWPHDSLPVDPDLEPENRRETGPQLCRTCGYPEIEFGCSSNLCRREIVLSEMSARNLDRVIVHLRVYRADGALMLEQTGSARDVIRIIDPDAIRHAAYVEASTTLLGR